MKRRSVALVLFSAIAVLAGRPEGRPQSGAPPTTTSTRAHVEALASAPFDGRLAGSAGERLASDYLVSELRKLGARPLPGKTDYLMAFDFTAGTGDGGSWLAVAGLRADAPATAASGTSRRFGGRADVRALSFSDNSDVSGEVVFAGYGIVVPDGQDVAYDSYSGLDVKDKIVLALRYFPEDADHKTRTALARYADLRYKALAARQRAARALLVVTGPRRPNPRQRQA